MIDHHDFFANDPVVVSDALSKLHGGGRPFLANDSFWLSIS
jgi:hypothetical protein